jgi:hypothetical protein
VEVDGRRRRRARVVVVLTALLLAFALWGGKRWWDGVDGEARSSLFRPFRTHAAVSVLGGRPVLTLAIDDPRRQEWTPLIPDHGKLMHLFLLREPGLDAFAHLHPVAQGTQGADRFRVTLPPLPPGSYRVYADIVHESGFPQTLVGRVTIPVLAANLASAAPPAAAGNQPPEVDPDDSWRATEPLKARGLESAGPKLALLADGGSMLWHQEPLRARQEVTLRFEVRGADGQPAALEPYMGMPSHAVISRDDGQVFVHLHPMGTVSMAAQQAFEKQEGGTGGGMAGMAGMDRAGMKMESARPGALSFPYEFPRSGRYRLWVQVKIDGKVQTAVFDAEVA